jgi:hypothetical protein
MKGSRLVLAAAAPAALWLAGGVIWIAMAAAGITPGDGRTMTLSEAAAVASHADVARLLGAGADPNARARVRAHLVRNDERMLTPLEASTGAIRTGPLGMLVDRGARIDSSTYPVLVCAAQDRHNDDMLKLLQAHQPSDVLAVYCANVRSVW